MLTLAVHKFASCDGCQLTLLDAEDELLEIADAIHIANFPEASREVIDGPYDLSLVEGSITTEADVDRLRTIRAQSHRLVAIGACATAGGIQALRNWADIGVFTGLVYAHPEYISTRELSEPIADHVDVDFELRGCPIAKGQLLEVVGAMIAGRRPRVAQTPVCGECKARGATCVMVASGTPCLGPVTHAGCGALCPAFGRGCYGCFGPAESPNMDSLISVWRELGVADADLVDAVRSFNAWAPQFRVAGDSVRERGETP